MTLKWFKLMQRNILITLFFLRNKDRTRRILSLLAVRLVSITSYAPLLRRRSNNILIASRTRRISRGFLLALVQLQKFRWTRGMKAKVLMNVTSGPKCISRNRIIGLVLLIRFLTLRVAALLKWLAGPVWRRKLALRLTRIVRDALLFVPKPVVNKKFLKNRLIRRKSMLLVVLITLVNALPFTLIVQRTFQRLR